MSTNVTLLLILGGISIVIALILFGGISFITTRKLIRDNTDLVKFIIEKKKNQESDEPATANTRLKEIKESRKSFGDMTDERVMAYIDSEMDAKEYFRRKDLSLKELSIELGLPQSRIVSVLRDREYGTLKEYLTARRLLYACELLQTKPYYTIDSISSDAGFKARKTFQTLFKARIGVTPSQYRDNYRIQQNLEAPAE